MEPEFGGQLRGGIRANLPVAASVAAYGSVLGVLPWGGTRLVGYQHINDPVVDKAFHGRVRRIEHGDGLRQIGVLQ